MNTKNDEIEEIDVFAEVESKKNNPPRVKKRGIVHNKEGMADGEKSHTINLSALDWMRLGVGQIILSKKRGKNISKGDFLSEAIEKMLQDNDIDFVSLSKKLFNV